MQILTVGQYEKIIRSKEFQAYQSKIYRKGNTLTRVNNFLDSQRAIAKGFTDTGRASQGKTAGLTEYRRIQSMIENKPKPTRTLKQWIKTI